MLHPKNSDFRSGQLIRNGDDDLLFALIYDAKRRGLAADDVANLRREEETIQRSRKMRETVAEAGSLFREKKYTEYVSKVAPLEVLLGGMDKKKLALARKKAT